MILIKKKLLSLFLSILGGTALMVAPHAHAQTKPRVSIHPPASPVNQHNVHDFPLSGTCSEEGRPVILTAVKSLKMVTLPQQPTCSGGVWQTNPQKGKGLELTFLTGETSTTITFLATQTNTAGVSSQAYIHHNDTFFCPAGFIPVPHREGFYPFSSDKSSFCIAKYEMTSHSDYHLLSQSKANTGLPLKVVKEEALARCASLGRQYELITNRDWQMTAKNLELVDSNWMGGKVGSKTPYIGNSDQGRSVHTSANDDEGCLSTEGIVCSFKDYRRTLTLSNGFVIWDFSGNVAEWIKDSFLGRSTTGISPLFEHRHSLQGPHAYQVNDVDHPDILELGLTREEGPQIHLTLIPGGQIHLKRFAPSVKKTARALFGPAGNYPQLRNWDYGWLGMIILEDLDRSPKGFIIRGGGRFGPSTGLFGTSSPRHWPSFHGFRCTFRPELSPPKEKKIFEDKNQDYNPQDPLGKPWRPYNVNG